MLASILTKNILHFHPHKGFSKYLIIKTSVQMSQHIKQNLVTISYFCISPFPASNIIMTRSDVLATAMTCLPRPLPKHYKTLPLIILL